MRLAFILFLPAFLTANEGWCQVDTSRHGRALRLASFLHLVGTRNLGYLAEQYQVSITEAGIESAKVFPDPQLTLGAYDNQERKLGLGRGYSAGIGGIVELGGKRRRRIELAQSQADRSKALLVDYFRNLRADAALSYFKSIRLYERLKVLTSSYAGMRRLAEADSIRYRLGTATDTDARQSRLEAASQLNEVYQSEADWRMSLVDLKQLMGDPTMDTQLFLVADFDGFTRQYDLYALLDSAVLTRADAVSARLTRAIADQNLRLVQTGRLPDLGLSAGYMVAGEATNDIAPTPAYNSVSVSLSVPLKFSNRFRGDLKAARLLQDQSVVLQQQTELQIRTEVRQAYTRYQAAQKQLLHYRGTMLTDARQILDGKIYSYQRGEASLLEVLQAQRTYNEVQLGYDDALYQSAATQIELQRSAGFRDPE